MRRAIALVVVLAAVALTAPAVEAYLKLGFTVGTRVVGVRFTRMPVRYFVTSRDVPGVTAAQLQAAMQRAFGTWEGVRTAQLSSSFAGFTSAEPFVDDGNSVMGFRSRPELERTLGATTFDFDDTTGEILESDIFLNTSFSWSVAAAGEPDRFDLESVGLHEIGHLLGLGHSLLGETEIRPTGGRRVLGKRAVMFPIAFPAGNIEDRTPEADDIAGLSDIYPTAAFTKQTGGISGRVTLNGTGLFGAHITAFNSKTGALVGGFSLNAQGFFVVSGLTPGYYVVRVEPLDDGDLDSFFDDDAVVNVNFRPRYYDQLVAVPAGGVGPSIEIKVTAK